MQNEETESRQRLDSTRSRTECTASGEVHSLCAFYQAYFQNLMEASHAFLKSPEGLVR